MPTMLFENTVYTGSLESDRCSVMQFWRHSQTRPQKGHLELSDAYYVCGQRQRGERDRRSGTENPGETLWRKYHRR